jgi:hypothetical protein
LLICGLYLISGFAPRFHDTFYGGDGNDGERLLP